MNAERQFLYVDGGAGYTLALDQSTLRIARAEEIARLVPIRRVDRVILRQPRSHTLRALLELVRHGVAVHFQDGDGRITAALVSTEAAVSPWAQEWALALRRHVNRPAYHDWLDMQLRHAASVILRRNPCGLISRFEQRCTSTPNTVSAPRNSGICWKTSTPCSRPGSTANCVGRP